jgi:hypothetical protein
MPLVSEPSPGQLSKGAGLTFDLDAVDDNLARQQLGRIRREKTPQPGDPRSPGSLGTPRGRGREKPFEARTPVR